MEMEAMTSRALPACSCCCRYFLLTAYAGFCCHLRHCKGHKGGKDRGERSTPGGKGPAHGVSVADYTPRAKPMPQQGQWVPCFLWFPSAPGGQLPAGLPYAPGFPPPPPPPKNEKPTMNTSGSEDRGCVFLIIDQ